MKITLSGIDKQLKRFLLIYLIVITIGVTVGLIYLSKTTSMTPKDTVERYNGSEIKDNDIEIAESYPITIMELLTTTHSHLLGMSFIFLSTGMIFYFNTVIRGLFKTIIMVEPLVSLVVTFGSIWLIRFVNPVFVYLTFLSAFLMYTGFYFIILISLYELVFVKRKV